MRPWEWGTVQTAARLAAGDISALERTGFYLARITAGNAVCNAVVVVRTEAARKAAREADRALARGDRRAPLGG